jgi:hypothetical protein
MMKKILLPLIKVKIQQYNEDHSQENTTPSRNKAINLLEEDFTQMSSDIRSRIQKIIWKTFMKEKPVTIEDDLTQINETKLTITFEDDLTQISDNKLTITI